MTCAGAQVDFAITCRRGMPRFSILDMTLAMSFIPPFMLTAWMSVLIVSGENPCRVAGTAC